ncbi:Pr6Pr family membrane protein [Dyella telluris]|uniref:Pr6Pr family membrane protein n=1 Tax=Dyella telluris TaxID=2763498 RepID=A0A7G8QA00_9GAMM|nr:Pr6Pr family membrane protein [Dyella telluris]QNK03608.1 Pr6Pr family membrane protein [Dyella telluris]
MPYRYRPLAMFSALLGWFGLALQLWFSVRLALDEGHSAFHGVWIYLGYYTILTNLLIAAVLTAAALDTPTAVSRFLLRPGVQTAAAMSIVIVSAVYNLMLRQLWTPTGWVLVADVIVHDLMPPLYVLYWWLAVPKASLRWPQVIAWQSYPAGYFTYVLLRGAVNGWYPYPFLDVKALGYLQVVLDALGVLVAFIVVALLLVALGRWQARRQGDAVPEAA